MKQIAIKSTQTIRRFQMLAFGNEFMNYVSFPNDIDKEQTKYIAVSLMSQNYVEIS